MDLPSYDPPFYYEGDAIFKRYYLSKDMWLLKRFDNECRNEYYMGNGYGIVDYRYDTNIIFKI